MSDLNMESGPRCECGHEARWHKRNEGEMRKYGPHLCYGKGDGGWPGPFAGVEPCACRQYRPVVLPWREVTALEAARFCTGKQIVSVEPEGIDTLTTVFGDGTKLRVVVEQGTDYSEHTSDPARIVIEVYP